MNIRGTDPTALSSVADLFLPSAGHKDTAAEFQRALQPATPTTPPQQPARREDVSHESDDAQSTQHQVQPGNSVAQEPQHRESTTEVDEEVSLVAVAPVPVEEEPTDSDLAEGGETAQFIAAAQQLAQEQLVKNLPEPQKIPDQLPAGEQPASEISPVTAVATEQIPPDATGPASEGPPIPVSDLAAPTQFDAPSAIPAEPEPEPEPAPVEFESPRDEQTFNLPPADSAAAGSSATSPNISQQINIPANSAPVHSKPADATVEHVSPRKQSKAIDPSTTIAEAPAVLPTTTADSNSNNDREPADDPRGSQRQLTRLTEDIASATTSLAPDAPAPPIASIQPTAAEVPSPAQSDSAPQQPANPSPATGSPPPINTTAAIIQRLPTHALVRNDPGSQLEGSPVQIDSARFLQRVARAFESARERGGEIRLRLSPPELGALRMEVTMQEQGLVARVEVETPEARAALMENLPLLRERLAEQNLRLERFEVNLSQRESTQQGNEFADQNSERQPQSQTRQPRTPVTRQPTVQPVIPQVATPTGMQERRLNVIV